jgi:hypothetical protein
MCSAYSGKAHVGNRPMPVLQGVAPKEHKRNRLAGSCVCALGIVFQVDDESRGEVHNDEMTFFTHRVNGQTYGAWYRQLGPRELEIMGTGFMCKAAYAGCDELSVARSVLEDVVRGQMQSGTQPQSLDSLDQRDSTPR